MFDAVKMYRHSTNREEQTLFVDTMKQIATVGEKLLDIYGDREEIHEFIMTTYDLVDKIQITGEPYVDAIEAYHKRIGVKM